MFRFVFRGLVAVGLAVVTYHYSDIGLDTGCVRNCCCLSDNTVDRGFTTRWLRIVTRVLFPSKIMYFTDEPLSMVEGIPKQFEDQFWSRHSNPRSGWTRVPLGAVIVYALYRRNWRLLGAVLVWTAVNPVLFSPPEAEDAWMTRAVLAERWWIREETNRTVGFGYPNIWRMTGVMYLIYEQTSKYCSYLE